MICKPCGVAGDLVAVFRENKGNVTFHAPLRMIAGELHTMCKGSTHCDCQHMIDTEGKAIERQTSGKLVSQDRKSTGKTS